MSNYLSKPIETAPIVSNYNFELINQVLATKQGQYNYNREKLQNAIAYVENLKVSRPQDQEYLNAKISEMYSTLNMGDKNLSDGVVADSYYSAIMSVAQDPTIVNAVGSTQVINNFYANIQKMQSDPKTAGWVNNDNIAYALENSGVDAYMRGEIDSVKSINYINYTDIQQDTLDTLKKVKELRGEEVVEIRGTGSIAEGGNGIPVGEVQVKKVNGMTPREMMEAIPGLLTPQQQQQMAINGWALSKRNPEGVQAQYDNIYNSQVTSYTNEIEVQKSIINNSTKSNEEKEQAKNRLKRLELDLERIKEDGKNKSLESKGYYVEQENFINTVATSAGARISTTYEKDDVYFARQNLDIQLEKLRIAQDKERRELNPTFDASLSTSTFQGEYDEELDIYTNLENQYKANNEKLTGLITDVVGRQGIDKTVLSDYDAMMKSMGYDRNGRVIDANLAKDISKEEAMYTAYTKSGLSKIAGNSSADIEVAKKLADNIAVDYDNFLLESVEEVFKENPQQYINDFTSYITEVNLNANKRKEYADKVISLINEISGGNAQTSDILTSETYLTALGVPKSGIVSFKANEVRAKLNDLLPKATKQQLKQFADIYEEVRGDSSSIISTVGVFPVGIDRALTRGRSLKSDAKKRTDDKAKEKGAQAASFGTANLVTISGKNTVKSILDAVPNESGKQQFDYSKNITVRRGADGSIIVTQGTPVTSTGKQAPSAEHTFGIYDDGYAMISSLIDQNELDRGLDANIVSTSITHSSSPKFIGAENEDLVNKTTSYFIANIPTSLSRLNVNLANYLTESSTKQAYEYGLKRVLPEDQVKQTAETLISQIPNFRASFVPVDGQWSLEIKHTNGKILHKGQVTSAGYLEKNLLNLITNYPETLIADKLLEIYMKNPDLVNKIFR